MDKAIINVYTDHILNNPRGTVLFIPVFQENSISSVLYKKVDQLLNKELSKQAKEFSFNGQKNQLITVYPSGSGIDYQVVVVIGLGSKEQFTISRFQDILATTLRQLASDRHSSISCETFVQLGDNFFEIGRTISEALYLSQYRFDKYKTKNNEPKKIIKEINIYLNEADNSKENHKNLSSGIALGQVISSGVYLTRDLVNEPARQASPEHLEGVARDIAKKSGGVIRVKVLEKEECQKLGMNAYLAVAQGSHRASKFITLEYVGSSPGSTSANPTKSVCLIGKSITFDSGGLSLKTGKGMETMKLDMAGGATVLGIFSILSQLDHKIPLKIFGILPACENMPGGGATRPGDVVTALNGTSIEIINTDAEGRLALSDALSYAEKFLKPDVIVDIATLAGAIIVALGTDMAAFYSNNPSLAANIKGSAATSGEDIWEMPLYQPYAKFMKGDIADLRNISSRQGCAGATTAALFLSEFVRAKAWAHLEIAGTGFNEYSPHGVVPKGGTGWGVRTIYNLINNLVTGKK